MASTFAGRLASGEHHDLRLKVTVQGVPHTFTEEAGAQAQTTDPDFGFRGADYGSSGTIADGSAITQSWGSQTWTTTSNTGGSISVATGGGSTYFDFTGGGTTFVNQYMEANETWLGKTLALRMYANNVRAVQTVISLAGYGLTQFYPAVPELHNPTATHFPQATGAWFTVVFVFAGGGTTAYIVDTAYTTTGTAMPAGTQTLRLGSAAGHAAPEMRVSDVLGWNNVTITEADIKAAFAALDVASSDIRSIVKIEQAETSLDMLKRRQVGGGLTVTLQDDAAGTLLALFKPRAVRSTWLTSTITAASTTLSVNATTGLTSPVYIDGETVTFTGTSGGTSLTGCARGTSSSEAAAHVGGTDTGAGVYQSPPTWSGRRVTLTGYFLNGDGTTTTDLTSTLGTFMLEEAPVFIGNGAWELRCAELGESIARRKVGSGVRAGSFYPPGRNGNGDFVFALAQDADQYLFPNISGPSVWVRVDPPSGDPFIAPVGSVAGSSVTIGQDTVAPYGRASMRNALPDESMWKLTPLCILTGALPYELILQVIESRLGDSTNGARDILVGTARSAFGGAEIRMGAGLSTAYVDAAAFLAVGAFSTQWSYVIDGETTLGDVLADWCLAANAIWYTDADGLLTVATIGEDGAASSTTIDSSVLIGEPSVTYDEENIYPRVTLRCDYSPMAGEFIDELNILDTELQAKYPAREDALVVESRSLRINPPSTTGGWKPPGLTLPGMTIESARDMMRRIQSGSGRGRVLVRAKTTLETLGAYIGDVCTVTAEGVPNYEGGTLSATGGRIISRRPNYDEGTVELGIELVSTLYRIAPAALVDSLGGSWPGTPLINLNTTAFENASSSPGNMFATTWSVWIFDVSANTYEERTIVSKTTTSITLDSATTFTPVAGDFITVPEQPGTPSSPSSTNGYAKTNYVYLMPSNPTAADFITRWR